jgi:WD40 repeat protein
MKPIERIEIFMHFKKISPHAFEQKIDLSNGYFSKQLKNLGSVGSDILIKIYQSYPELDILWILTGEGQMLKEADQQSSQIDEIILEDFTNKYTSENKKLKKLENDFDKLQTSLTDKEKIIGLYEFMLNGNPSITSSSVVKRVDA